MTTAATGFREKALHMVGDAHPTVFPTRVVFGLGRLVELGALARDEGAAHVLLVTDPGIVAAGHVGRALRSLESAGLNVTVFDGARENPTTEHVAAGVEVARAHPIDFIIGLGGGSSMDCAKGINLILSNGGSIADYWGENKAAHPMLPMIAVPTTAGTGSEAQSFALISDPVTHQKMACGDRRLPSEGGLRPRVAILDAELTRSQPPAVAAACGIDAMAHAVETAASTRRSEISRESSRQAWRLLESAYERAVRSPSDTDARENMLLGAHLAGAAIELSMLGAAHACANPLTACFGMVHGFAVGLMLPHVIRFNTSHGPNPYSDLGNDPDLLARRVEHFLDVGSSPRRLRDCGVNERALGELAEMAADQWTARFNPRPVGPDELDELYHAAF